MSNVLEYKGYHTKVQYDTETCILHGKIEGIRDFVNFETSNPEEVKKEFHAAVDDYLEFCEEVGKAPDKEYRGTFNVRIDPSLHRELALEADKKDISMNQMVESAIEAYLHKNQAPVKTIVYVKENETKSSSQVPAVTFNFPTSDFFTSNSLVTSHA